MDCTMHLDCTRHMDCTTPLQYLHPLSPLPYLFQEMASRWCHRSVCLVLTIEVYVTLFQPIGMLSTSAVYFLVMNFLLARSQVAISNCYIMNRWVNFYNTGPGPVLGKALHSYLDGSHTLDCKVVVSQRNQNKTYFQTFKKWNLKQEFSMQRHLLILICYFCM